MKALSKNIFSSSKKIGNHTTLNTLLKLTSSSFSDWSSNGVVGSTVTRQVRENFVSPNGYAVFNSAGHKKLKAKIEKVDNNKDFPNNSARLNFLKGKK